MCECRAIGRIKVDCPVQKGQGFEILVRANGIDMRQGTEKEVIGSEVFRRLAPGAFDLGPPDRRLDGADHMRRDLVLQIEDILKNAVIALGPEMGAGRGIDQLTGDAEPVARLADAALEHIAHAQFPRDLADVDGAALVGEGGIARDDEAAD